MMKPSSIAAIIKTVIVATALKLRNKAPPTAVSDALLPPLAGYNGYNGPPQPEHLSNGRFNVSAMTFLQKHFS